MGQRFRPNHGSLATAGRPLFCDVGRTFGPFVIGQKIAVIRIEGEPCLSRSVWSLPGPLPQHGLAAERARGVKAKGLVRFSREAMAARGLLLQRTEILPGTFASTTKTADWLSGVLAL